MSMLFENMERLTLDIRINKKLSTSKVNVFSVFIRKIPSTNSGDSQNYVNELIEMLLNKLEKENIDPSINLLPYPQYSHVCEMPDGQEAKTVYYLEPSNKLNAILCESYENISSQIKYIELMGITHAIDRRPELREAVEYVRFNDRLRKYGIFNPSFVITEPAFSVPTVKRIHAVHSDFLDDPEIRSGLFTSVRRNTAEDHVMYVCNEKTLSRAIQCCIPSSALIIDGHWAHGYGMTHGVWRDITAEEIGTKLSSLLHAHPGQIKSIRLYGCHSGFLAEEGDLMQQETTRKTVFPFDPTRLRFKDEMVPSFTKKVHWQFRNRALYGSEEPTDIPFHAQSLAGQLYTRIADLGVKVTASPSFSYPYPALQEQAEYNIGSDAEEWTGPHYWQSQLTKEGSQDMTKREDLRWYDKLQCMKSISVFPMMEMNQFVDEVTGWTKLTTNNF